VLGGKLGLPHAYSGHNAFGEWGPPPARDGHALVIAYRPPPEFADCRVVATVDNGVGLENDEQGVRVQLCRLTAPWPQLWPQLRHYG
jgi:hypothetical protein